MKNTEGGLEVQKEEEKQRLEEKLEFANKFAMQRMKKKDEEIENLKLELSQVKKQ